MPESPQTPPPQLTVPVQEAGWVFRLEMMFSNLLLGYFRHVLALVALVLVGVFIYGQVRNYQVGAQKSGSEAITAVRVELRDALFAKIDPEVANLAKTGGYSIGGTFRALNGLPEADQQRLATTSPELVGAQELLQALPRPAQDELFAAEDELTAAWLFIGLPNEEEKKIIDDAAKKLVGVATAQSGAAAAIGLLDAADWFERAGDAAGRRDALEKALATGVADPARAAATIGLAALDLDAGQNDAAIDRLRQLSTSTTGYYQERAEYELAMALELAGKTDEARTAWGAFATKHPTSEHAEDARRREKKLGGGAAAAPAGEGTDDGPLVAPPPAAPAEPPSPAPVP